MVVHSNTLSAAPRHDLPFRGALRFVGVFLFYALLFLLISLITHPEVLHPQDAASGGVRQEQGK